MDALRALQRLIEYITLEYFKLSVSKSFKCFQLKDKFLHFILVKPGKQ